MAGKSEAVLVVVKSDPPDTGGDIWRRKCQRLKRKCEEFEQVSNRGNFTKSSIIIYGMIWDVVSQHQHILGGAWIKGHQCHGQRCFHVLCVCA